MTTTLTQEEATDFLFESPDEDLIYDSAIIEAFMHGDCWVLAYHLAEQADYNIAVSACGGDKTMWNHFSLMLDKNHVLDITGIHTLEEITKTHKCICLSSQCDGVVTREITVDEWDELTALNEDGMRYCIDGFDGDYVLDISNDRVAVADVAQALINIHL